MLLSAPHALRPFCHTVNARGRLVSALPARRSMAAAAALPRKEVDTAQEASDLLKQGYIYVDVRSPDEFRAGHVPGSLNVPLSPALPAEFKAKFGDSDLLLVGCQSGRRASQALDALGSAFPNAVLFKGSHAAWLAAGLPIEK